jgi:glycosyltransferase involved in cell wall biosynthesis
MVVLYRTKIEEHRNWEKVENELEKLDIEGIFISFCDLYFLDIKTPITEPWYGIIHNPIGWEIYSPWQSNNIPLFEKRIFLDSLKSCKLLFVMAESQIKPIHELVDSKEYTIKIVNLYHPIENLKCSFNYELYRENTNKTIFNIGNWLRKQYTIFKLGCPTFKKAILPFSRRTEEELQFYLKLDNQTLSREEYESVQKCKRLTDNEYHSIFESNLIFLDVYLTTINNTFLEALISNTPIILRRQPEFVSILGKGYPLFFDTLDEINDLVKDDESISKAHSHLKSIDKSKFTMDYFIETIRSNIIEQLIMGD